MSGFFDRAGIRDVMTAHQLFNHVTGLQIVAANDSEFMAQVRVCVCVCVCVCVYVCTCVCVCVCVCVHNYMRV